MSKRDYPKEVELKVEDRVRRGSPDAFNTEDQQQAARDLREYWPIQFKDLAEKTGRYTDGHYRHVLNAYFGPVDGELTFDEIWDEYGTMDKFYEAKEGANPETQDAYERGYEKGFKAGYELAKSEDDN